MLIHEITLENFLSFGKSSDPIPLQPLNVLIGPNGSGKSNFLEAIDLLRCAPNQFLKPIREGGGVAEWLWKGGEKNPTASIDAVIDNPKGRRESYSERLRYNLSFTAAGQSFEIVDEKIENEKPAHEKSTRKDGQPYFYYHFNAGDPVLNVLEGQRRLRREDIDFTKSILAQRRDPDQYPEITYLAKTLEEITLYREWSFGRYTSARLPQRTDMPNLVLEPDGSNLALVLNRLRRYSSVKERFLETLQKLYPGIEDFDIQIEGSTAQVFLQERTMTIPATRLSDGTLRYLCLLAVLCQPDPPPLICIEEPELGLHPDVLPTLADLLKEASKRTQIIVTTHSDVLVDAMTDQPESVVVCERDEQGTTMNRLSKEKLKPWLEKYRLGELWKSGDIGGNRW